jgi:squalene-hopene/tetraprenyl-beta-curcumene cyclase
MVIIALDELGDFPEADRGAEWLCAAQNGDGGWGSGRGETPSTIEETSLALRALASRKEAAAAVARGIAWLCEKTKNGTDFGAAPIGFYFARLWYFEKSYPIIWATDALREVAAVGGPTGE